MSARTLAGVASRRLGSLGGNSALRSERCVRNPGLALRAATPSASWLRITPNAASGGSAGCSSLSASNSTAAVEVLGQHLDGEIGAGLLLGADVIERLLKCEAVELLAAVGKQAVQQLCDAFLAGMAPAFRGDCGYGRRR